MSLTISLIILSQDKKSILVLLCSRLKLVPPINSMLVTQTYVMDYHLPFIIQFLRWCLPLAHLHAINAQGLCQQIANRVCKVITGNYQEGTAFVKLVFTTQGPLFVRIALWLLQAAGFAQTRQIVHNAWRIVLQLALVLYTATVHIIYRLIIHTTVQYITISNQIQINANVFLRHTITQPVDCVSLVLLDAISAEAWPTVHSALMRISWSTIPASISIYHTHL